MIQYIALTVMLIWGVKAVFTFPFIFYKIGDAWEDRLPKWMIKPLYRCSVCMSSVYGTGIYLWYISNGVIDWAIFILCVAGVNFVINEFLYPEEA